MFAKDGAVSGSSAMSFAKSAGEPPDQSAPRSATSDFILKIGKSHIDRAVEFTHDVSRRADPEASTAMNYVSGTGTNRSVTGIAVSMIVLVASQLALAQAPPKNLTRPVPARPVVAIDFNDADGRSRSLADFNGKIVLLNLWATWCVPCRKEMPALDRLQASLGGPDFEVIPLSIDRGGFATVRKFYDEIAIRHLGMYADVSGQTIRWIHAMGLPTTLLVDRAGREIGLVIGAAEWDSPEIGEFLKSVISMPSNMAPEAVQNTETEGVPAERNLVGPLRRAFKWLKTLFSRPP
jgi:thiol-disulfide isomerase/thioredoxin